MLRIRLRRMGSNQKPYYRIVVSDSRRTPTSKFVDTLGSYEPGRKPHRATIDVERTDEWIRKGAHPSETVKSLLERARSAAG